jgi:lipoprotein-releasing system ATP-binding protein
MPNEMDDRVGATAPAPPAGPPSGPSAAAGSGNVAATGGAAESGDAAGRETVGHPAAASEVGEVPVLLAAAGVTREFRIGETRIQVLRGIDLGLREGEILAVLGASGAGKSTLLHCLGGLDRPDAGTVRFRGQEIFSLAERELSRFRNRNMGFVFQFHHLMPEFTAEENVMMPGLVARQAPEGARRRARELLVEVGLADRAEHKPDELSGGEQQRVAVARSLFAAPALVLADEPTGNLDPATARGLHDLMYALARRHRQSWIVVTHNAELAALADTRVRLVDGVLRPEGSDGGRAGDISA